MRVVTGITFEHETVERVFFNLCAEAQLQPSPTHQRHKQKILVIAGPTGCGKSDFSMMLARQVDGEIVTADSMQVYRGMDIGTAKPTKEMRLAIPHHLLDIRDITDPFNVVDFVHESTFVFHTIRSRETLPIVVGGSGFYLHALLYGPPMGPPPVPEIRKALEFELETVGADVLYEKLRALDPEYAGTITTHDRHKIVRALEIIALTKTKVSQLDWRRRTQTKNYDFHCWFLHRPKVNLYHRIEKRCDKMVHEGFIEEVARLEQEGLRENSTASQAIGYRQALEYLSSARSRSDFDHFMEEFKKASRHYAKRQLTWFRREPLFRWLDIDAHDYETAAEIIVKDLG